MCGRAGSGRSATVIMHLTGAHRLGNTAGYAQSFNVAPGNHVMALVRRPVSQSREQSNHQAEEADDLIVVPHALPDDTDGDVCKVDHKDEGNDDSGSVAVGDKEVVLEAMKWGLVPWFTKPDDVSSVGSQAINARSETVNQKPFFRHLVNKRRCVVVVDGFFEWKKFEVLGQPRRQAYYVSPTPPQTAGGMESPQPLLYLAGLWDVWRSKDSNEQLVTCTILTTEATAEFGGLHDRMPVVLQPENVAKWLDTDTFKFDQLLDLLPPYKENGLSWYEVTDKVNSIKNRSAENIEPLALHKAKGIGRFFGKPKSVDDDVPLPQPESKTPSRAHEDYDDVIVVGGSLPSSRPKDALAASALYKSPAKKKKIEQLPGQKSLTSFFK